MASSAYNQLARIYSNIDKDKYNFYTIKYFKTGASLSHIDESPIFIDKDYLITYLTLKLNKNGSYSSKLKSKVLKYKYQPGGSISQQLKQYFESLIAH